MFVDTLKRVLKNAQGTPTDRALQQFLLVYIVTPNANTPMGRSPAETMFARKIRSVFDRLIPRQDRFKKIVTLSKKNVTPVAKKYYSKFIKITRRFGKWAK